MKVKEFIEESLVGHQSYIRSYNDKINAHKENIAEWEELIDGHKKEMEELISAREKL